MEFTEWNPNGPSFECPPFEQLPIAGDDYEQIEALNWSTLNRFLKEPAYFKRNPDWQIESTGFEMGNYVHRMLLQGDEYGERYAEFVPPTNPKTGEPYKSGKKYQAAMDEFIASGKYAIPERGREILTEIKENLASHGLLKWLDGEKEVPLIGEWKELKLKGRVDVYNEEFGILDLKTANSQLYSLEQDNFRFKIRELGYAGQLAFYATLVEQATGSLPPCRILAVQTTAPYQVCLYEFTPELIRVTSQRILDEFLPAFQEYKLGGIPNIFARREVKYL